MCTNCQGGGNKVSKLIDLTLLVLQIFFLFQHYNLQYIGGRLSWRILDQLFHYMQTTCQDYFIFPVRKSNGLILFSREHRSCQFTNSCNWDRTVGRLGIICTFQFHKFCLKNVSSNIHVTYEHEYIILGVVLEDGHIKRKCHI